MNIEIKIVSQRLIHPERKNSTQTTICLLDKEVLLDSVIIVEEHRLSEDLLPTIDELLKKNKLTTQDIAEMTVKSDMDDNFTTPRIAKSVANAFNWAKTR